MDTLPVVETRVLFLISIGIVAVAISYRLFIKMLQRFELLGKPSHSGVDNGIGYFAPSTAKLIVMSICTLGLYIMYWFYKNWLVIKKSGKKCNPALRSLFDILFAYSCFWHIKKSASSNGINIRLPVMFCTLLFIALTVFGHLPDPYWLISFLDVLPIALVNRAAMQVNQTLTPGYSDNKFSLWNCRIIFFGGIVVMLAVVSAFLPEV